MSAFDIRIDISDTMTGPLRRIKEAGGDLTPAFAEISEKMLEHTQDRFGKEYGPDGVPWELTRRVMEGGGRILFERGDLYNAIERDSGRDFAMVGVQATGGPAVYARTHQDGATIRPRTAKALKTPFGPRASVTIVARPFLGIEVRDRTATEQIILAHLARAGGGTAA